MAAAAATATATAGAGGAMGFVFPCSVANYEDLPGLGPCFLDEAGAIAERAAAEEKDARMEEDWADLEPFFFDEEAAVADHKRRMRREQRRQQVKAHKEKLEKAYWEAWHRIREYDPKHGSTYFTRVHFVDDLATFDHDEESPLGPMRETEASIDVDGIVCTEGTRKFVPSYSANVFSVNISSDVGFPIDVYGTVIARDNIDLKSVYLFCRDRDHCQLILTKDESLILTGPKRGLALSYSMHFEFDLKIKGVGRQRDKQLSKGFLTLNDMPRMSQKETKVQRCCLDTRLSEVSITYAIVKSAVEATFAVELVQGRFFGEITACTTSIRDNIVLHDSRLVEAIIDGNGKGAIQLLQRVVAVCLKEKLIVTIAARTGDGKTKKTTTKFTPGINGAEEKEISCGFVKMRVKVTWSIIEREYIDNICQTKLFMT